MNSNRFAPITRRTPRRATPAALVVLALSGSACQAEDGPKGVSNEPPPSVDYSDHREEGGGPVGGDHDDPSANDDDSTVDDSTGPETATHGPAPAQLVGSWSGGYGGDSEWRLDIAADGTYALVYPDDPRLADYGYLEVTHGGFSMRSSTPQTRVARAMAATGCDWEVEEMELYGYVMQTLFLCNRAMSYVRDVTYPGS